MMRNRLGTFALLLASTNSWASSDSPRLELPKLDLFKGCVRAMSGVDDGYVTGEVSWELGCPREEFLQKLSKQDWDFEESSAARLLTVRLLRDEIRKVRTEVLNRHVEPARSNPFAEWKLLDMFRGLFDAPLATLPKPEPFSTTEGEILAQTQSLAETAEKIAKPLFEGGEVSVLAPEGIQESLGVLGDSLRFDAAASLLNERYSLIESSSIQREIVQQVSGWVDAYGAAPLRPWLRARLEALRTNDVTGTKPEQLLYWTKSLELADAPVTDEAKKAVVDRLVQLWVVFPSPADANSLRRTAERVGVSKLFRPPGTHEMNFDQLLARAQAEVRAVDSPAALRTLKRVLKLPHDQLDAEKVWSALQLHSRILRITDQRHLIPDTMRSYMRFGRLMDAPSDPKELAKFLARGVEITRMAWSYDKPERADELLAKFLATARAKPGQDLAIAQLLYLRARIVEQSHDSAKASAAFTEALGVNRLASEFMTDLVWRNLLLQFDLARQGTTDPAALLALFEPAKKLAVENFDKGRWYYWRAQAQLLHAKKLESADAKANKKKIEKLTDDAVADLEQAYKTETFSFYSDLAGLELIRLDHKPSGWVLGSKPRTREPGWREFVTEAGEPKKPYYREIARIRALGSIGDLDGANAAARSVDVSLWDRLLSAKSPVHDKKAYARALSWLRIAIQDSLGSLRVAEVARQAYGPDFDGEDFVYLYPLPYWDGIKSEAEVRGLDPWLAASLIRQESAFNPKARSGANALGLMQMIPSVANADAKSLGLGDFKLQQLYEPATSIKLGVYHLSQRVSEMQGSWICATAAYNAGAPPVRKWLSNYDTTSPIAFIERISFAETRNYVRSILRNYMNYRRIYGEADFDLEKLTKMPSKAEAEGSETASEAENSLGAKPVS